MLPLWAVRSLGAVGIARARWRVVDILDHPDEGALRSSLVLREVRSGYAKWAHLMCPRCREHIQLPLAGDGAWKLYVDAFRRPTIRPSIWQTGSCGAHFFIDRGNLLDALR